MFSSQIFESCPDKFRELRSRPIASYFDESQLDSCFDGAALSDALTFDDSDLREFYSDFEKLLRSRKVLQGLARIRAFRCWWDEHRAAYLTRPVVRGYRDAGLSIGELLDEAHLHFMAHEARKRNSSFIGRTVRRVLKGRILVTAVLFIAFLFERTGAFAWNLLMLGPGVQIINSYTQPVITPLAQTVQQKGSQDLSGAASKIQSWLSNRGRLKEVNQRIQSKTEELRSITFSKLSPEQAQAKWKEFEDQYFKLFMQYNQTLPSHLRDGRAYFKDWMVFTPVYLASSVATFDSQYWIHKSALDSARTSRERREHRESMKAAEKRIAGSLAAWKLYEFMFPEISRAPGNAKARGDLGKTYEVFSRAMRFDVYIAQFTDEIALVLKGMDAEFTIQDELARKLSAT